jgi:hypothetical protein
MDMDMSTYFLVSSLKTLVNIDMNIHLQNVISKPKSDALLLNVHVYATCHSLVAGMRGMHVCVLIRMNSHVLQEQISQLNAKSQRCF